MPNTPSNIKFDQAIAFYKQKLPLPTEVWEQIIEESQDWAFTLAGVEKASVLQSVYNAIARIIEGKSNTVTTFESFSTQFDEIMEAGGYGKQKPWRSQLVFKQNINTAYNAGRYRTQTAPEAIKRRPYLQYIHNHPIVPRPHHKALHEKIWRADDPIWDYIYCPNGFGCNCQVQSLSERDMQREGLSLSDRLTERINLRDRISGEVKSVPAIKLQTTDYEHGASRQPRKAGLPSSRAVTPPPGSIKNGSEIIVPIAENGFNFAPGKSAPEQREEILQGAIARLSPRLQGLVEREQLK